MSGACKTRKGVPTTHNVSSLKVDAEIKDQPWDVALQAILAAQGLAATEDANGIIIVNHENRLRHGLLQGNGDATGRARRFNDLAIRGRSESGQSCIFRPDES